MIQSLYRLATLRRYNIGRMAPAMSAATALSVHGEGNWGRAVSKASRGGGRHEFRWAPECSRAHDVCAIPEGDMVACLIEFERHAGLIGLMKNGEPIWSSCFMGLGRWGWSWILARFGSGA